HRFNRESVEKLFEAASELIASATGRRAVRYQSSQVNAALAEALFVGLMRRLDFDADVDAQDVSSAIDDIQGDARLRDAISRSTADEEFVKARLEIATKRFARM